MSSKSSKISTQTSKGSSLRGTARLFTAIASVFAVVASVIVPATAAFAADPAAVRNTKSTTATLVHPGDTFNWMIEVGCSVLTDECVNATLTDVIPPEFIPPSAGDILFTPDLAASEKLITISGQTVTIDFKQNLVQPVGEVGLTNGTVTVTIPVTVRSDLDYTPTPVTVTNTSAMVADNAPELDSSANVSVEVPLELSADATKSFSPNSNLAVGGLTTDLTLGGTNTANAPVEKLTIQDPQNPADAGNIFQTALAVQSLGSVTWPAGADGATVAVWDTSLATPAWVAAPLVASGNPLSLPLGVALPDIGGVRIEFFSSSGATIPRSASASFVVSLANRAGITSGSYSNTSQVEVSRDSLSATDTATAVYSVIAATSAVSATKAIVPDRLSTVAYGANDLTHGTVTLTGTNAGTLDLTSMTIAEPTNPADLSASNPFAPAHDGFGLIFSGFDSGVAWPAGATAANITYFYDDGSSEVMAATAPGLPAADPLKRVTGFSVTFTGTMAQGSTATLPFTIQANPAQVAPNLSQLYTNETSVTGIDSFSQNVGPATATDTVTVLTDQINLATTKSLTRTELNASAGQSTIATLTTTVSDYPDSTRNLAQIVMYDPDSQTGTTDWYNYFDATGLTLTQVPGGATLSIYYRDALGVYSLLTTLPPGTNTYTIPSGIRDDIHGLKLEWNSPAGFVPGQTLVANVNYALRSNLREDNTPLPNAAIELENCSSSSGTSTLSPDSINSNLATSNPCPTVELIPTTGGPGGGGADLLEKNFINVGNTNDQEIMSTRNSERTRARLSWSTGGYTGVDEMAIYDGALDGTGDPSPTAYNLGTWDAFNLVRIPAINSALDPLMQFDKVYIQLYNSVSNSWVSTGICSYLAPCEGSTPAYNLTATEQAETLAIRFVFSEGSNRTGLDPAPGSGVADSTTHNRHIDLVFEMRDSLRSNAAWPVVDGYQYNQSVSAGGHSVIRNDAHSAATLSNGDVYEDQAADTIELRDPNLAVNVTKSWAGGSLPIPDGTVSPFPTSRVTISAINQTVGKVDSLTINEPNTTVATPNDSPFEQFKLFRFQSISHPAGATGLTVTVYRPNDGNLTATGTPASVATTVLAWTPADLADATGFTFEYTGRINGVGSSTSADIVFDLELQDVTRTSGTTVAASTVYNSTQALVADNRWDTSSSVTAPTFKDAELGDLDGANIQLVNSDIGVSTSKTFAKTSEVEPNRSQFSLTLKATPSGSERVQSLTITDDRATFWNAFDFVGVPANSPTLPTFSPNPTGAGTVIKIEVCTGGTWVAGDIDATPAMSCTDRGGSWQWDGTWKTQAQARSDFLPAGVSAGDVSGVRLTIKRADDSQWENPQAPEISIPITIQRRINLRSGDPVLTDYPGNAPSPGETTAGVTSNSLSAHVVGIWGKTSDASNNASYLYEHAENAVQVEKTPAGIKAPGRLFDYTLKVTNNGNWPIMNPVITDYLPSDGTGAMLIFDPDNAWNYHYALTGAAPSPANGTALPTGTTGATVVDESDAFGPTKLTFTFPAGSVLEVGQSFTITIPMMFRPGLINDTIVTNSFGIKGDRLFDACTAPAGKTASYDPVTGECSTSTTVKPSEQAALRAHMTVKANLDASYPTDLGYTGASGCDTAVDAAGFSRLPCIPLTLPGQSETWRLFAQNTGTTYMPRLVLATRLPEVSDKTILDNFVRNSKWDAGFADEITANLGVPGATLSVYYTTAASPCKLVLQDPANLNACGSDPATGWAPWTAGALADPTVVTGLQFVVDFPDAHLWAPSETLTIDVVTRTAALSATPGANTTANNSLSASSITRTGSTDTVVTALDYSVVSVALATGSVTLTKTITGPAASFIPDGQTFTGSLVCTSLGETASYPWTLTADTSTDPITVTGEQFDDLPGGASCTVTETSASGQTDYTATTVIVNPLADPTSLPNVTLNNDYQLAGITVSKTVTTTAPVYPDDFAFTLSCTFLGVAVPLAVGDAAFVLDDGESKTVTGIPANSNCVLTETDPKGADATLMSATTDTSNGGSSVAVNNTTRTATFTRLSPDTIAGVTNTANANNRFDAPAALVVTKHLEGGGSSQFGSTKTFTVHVLCTFGATTQYDGDVQLNAGNAWQAILENIIADSVCTFTETGLQGADAVVITPNDGTDTTTGVLVVPGPDVNDPSPVVDIAVTNWYLTGSVQVTKTFVGDQGAIDKFAIDPVPAIEFEFQLDCTRDGVAVLIPGGGTRIVTAASPVADYTGIASGADCVLSETRDGGSSQTRILDSSGSEVSGGEFTIDVDDTILSANDQAQDDLTVENRFRFASVAASKVVVAATGTKGPFELTLACTLDGREIEPAEPAAASINAGEVVTWTELAEGADCAITETRTGGATRTTSELMKADGTLGPTVIGVRVAMDPLRWTGDQVPNQVAFTNSFSLAFTGIAGNPSDGFGLGLGLIFGGGLAVIGGWFLRRRKIRHPEAQ